MPNLLTIAIPTYNRPGQLADSLNILVPQILENNHVELLLLDNRSEIPVSTILDQLPFDIPDGKVRVVRNACNVGGASNAMRCFELCKTDWLWILGDDDTPSANAVEIISEDASSDHCYCYYRVASNERPMFSEEDPITVNGKGYESFSDRFGEDSYQISLISSAVFNMKVMRQFIFDGYMTVNSGVPHLAMLFKGLAEGHMWQVSRRSVVEYNPPSTGEAWGLLDIALASANLFFIAQTIDEARIVQERIIQAWRPSPKKMLFSLITKYNIESRYSLYLASLFRMMKQLYAPQWNIDPMLRIRWIITEWWSYFPRFFASWYSRKKKVRVSLVNSERA